MLDPIHAQSYATADLANETGQHSQGDENTQEASNFASLLDGLAATTQTSSAENDMARPVALPAGLSLSASLHYLALRADPQPGTHFSSQAIASLKAGTARGTTRAAGQPFGSSWINRYDGSATSTQPMTLADYPRPSGDNGRGVHWIPTTQQSPEVVDRFMDRLQDLGIRWVTFLNEPGDLIGNEYLVNRLTEAGIEPVMRVYTDSGSTSNQDLTPLVQHFRKLGVSYFQLYNEPNLKVENQGRMPDLNSYVSNWIKAARQVVKGGGLPGLAPLSPQGDVDDLGFLRDSLQTLKMNGGGDLLGRSWLSVHNYGQDYGRVRRYDQIVRQVTGRSLPQIGTEAGIYPGGGVSEDDQIRIVGQAYADLAHREPYNFAYSLWVLANQAGGGHDDRWEAQALYRADGPSRLAQALETI